jgi:DNA-binding Xre family transcriptional regulator
MIQENTYYEKTSREIKKDVIDLINQINLAVLENESNHAVALSRLDSVCSLLQITLIHINNLNKQNKCATEEAENAANHPEATAAEETTLI